MLVRFEQYSKAESPILITLSGTIVFLQPATNILVDVFIIALQLFLESYTLLSASTIIDPSSEQLEKAESPILVTLLGISMLVSPEQPQKTPSSIHVTLLGISMLFRLEQWVKADSPILVTLLSISMLIKLEQPLKA